MSPCDTIVFRFRIQRFISWFVAYWVSFHELNQLWIVLFCPLVSTISGIHIFFLRKCIWKSNQQIFGNSSWALISKTSVFFFCGPDDVIKMETFSVLMAICADNSPVTGEFPTQRPDTRSFDVFFDLRLNKRLRKQSWGWWCETPSRSLWRHYNVGSDDCIPKIIMWWTLMHHGYEWLWIHSLWICK